MEENQNPENVMADNNQAPPAQDKTFTRDQLAKIVASETEKATQKARREAEEKYQRDLESLNATRAQQEQRNAEVPRDVDANALYQQVQERFNAEMKEQQLRQHMEGVATSYLQKVEQARGGYEDFDEVTKDFDPTAFKELTYLLAGIDNAGDVLYDLAKSPIKLAGIDTLAQKSPRQAQNELLKLSQSIRDNRQAQSDAQGQNVAEPLDRLQPSRVSGSNGKMGIRDLRNQPWLKG